MSGASAIMTWTPRAVRTFYQVRTQGALTRHWSWTYCLRTMRDKCL